MTTLVDVLALLLIAALSAPLAKIVAIPLPLVQIGLGTLASVLGLQVALDPGVFLLLFIPPLLFSDAFAVSKRAFYELRRIILAMAVGLVVFSTLGGGLFINLLLPALPMAACFTLAAILSPTDAVAVGGILRPGSVPRRFLHIIEGEALLNDATGLVCFKFASIAALTGVFSLADASLAFLSISAGGILVGVAIGYGFVKLDRMIVLPAMNDAATQIVLLLLLPFAAYLVADAVGVSGILSSVAAGFTISQMRLFGVTSTQTRLGSAVVLTMVGFVFNGLIFLLLGLQLPVLLDAGQRLSEGGRYSSLHLSIVVLAITVALIGLRFAWIWLAIGIRCLLAIAAGRRYVVKTNPVRAAGMAVAGVRGAVTLAGVLTLPLATPSGPGFPDREILVVIAAGVIVCSLLLASLCLPLLLRLDAGPAWDKPEEDGSEIRRALLRTALEEVERVRVEAYKTSEVDELLIEASGTLFEEFSRRIDQAAGGDAGEERAIGRRWSETAIRLRILRAQRAELVRAARDGRISIEPERQITRELDYEEELVLADRRRLPGQETARPDARHDRSANGGAKGALTRFRRALWHRLRGRRQLSPYQPEHGETFRSTAEGSRDRPPS